MNNRIDVNPERIPEEQGGEGVQRLSRLNNPLTHRHTSLSPRANERRIPLKEICKFKAAVDLTDDNTKGHLLPGRRVADHRVQLQLVDERAKAHSLLFFLDVDLGEVAR
jgi:hypothetical protein